MMRPPPSICSPASMALSCASPLMRPMRRSPARDRTITLVKQLGRRRWKKAQGSEAVIGCEILNRMTALGRPVSYRIDR